MPPGKSSMAFSYWVQLSSELSVANFSDNFIVPFELHVGVFNDHFKRMTGIDEGSIVVSVIGVEGCNVEL